MQKNNLDLKYKNNHGLTLVEIMVVVLIIGIVATIGYISWEEGAVRQKTTSEKLLMLSDLRLLGQEMMQEARNSNRFYIFESFPAQIEIDENGKGNFIASGETGNYLVLESLDLDGKIIERVGYYLTPGTEENLLNKYIQTHDGDDVPPLPTSSAGHKSILQEVEGDHASGNIFLNYASRTILVQGRFIENIDQVGGGGESVDAKRSFSFQLQPLIIE